jgi:hypothetical protein
VEVVQKGELAPGCCVLTGDIDGPFLDTGFVVNQETVGLFPRAYLHVPLVKQMGAAVGRTSGSRNSKTSWSLRTVS